MISGDSSPFVCAQPCPWSCRRNWNFIIVTAQLTPCQSLCLLEKRITKKQLFLQMYSYTVRWQETKSLNFLACSRVFSLLVLSFNHRFACHTLLAVIRASRSEAGVNSLPKKCWKKEENFAPFMKEITARWIDSKKVLQWRGDSFFIFNLSFLSSDKQLPMLFWRNYWNLFFSRQREAAHMHIHSRTLVNHRWISEFFSSPQNNISNDESYTLQLWLSLDWTFLDSGGEWKREWNLIFFADVVERWKTNLSILITQELSGIDIRRHDRSRWDDVLHASSSFHFFSFTWWCLLYRIVFMYF